MDSQPPEATAELHTTNEALRAENEQLRAEIQRLNDQIAQLTPLAARAMNCSQLKLDQQLLEREEQLNTVADAARVGLVMVDQEHRYRYVNRTYAEIFKLPSADIVGRQVAEILPSVYPDQIRPRLARAFAGERVRYELVVPPSAAGGVERIYTVTYRPDTYQGQPVVVVVVVEITDRRQIEADLRERSEVLDLTQVLVRDMDSRIVMWNRGAAQLYGFSAAEAVGQISHTLLRTEFPAPLPEIEAALLRDGAWSGELAHRRSDGSQVVVASQWLLHRDAHGQPARILEVNADITARKRAEQQLRLSEQRFATAFHASPAAMLITRLSDGRIIDVNASYERMFGYARDELIGQTGITASIYTSPEQRSEIVKLLRERGTIQNLELTLRTKSGELRTALGFLEITQINGETCTIGSMVDITERKQAEQALQRSTERLQILANASHALAAAENNQDTVLKRIAKIAAGQLGATCIIRMLAEDGEWLDSAAVYDPDPAAQTVLQAMFAREHVHIDSGHPAAKVLRTGQPLLTERFDMAAVRTMVSPEQWQAFEQFQPHSAVLVPLVVQGRSIGTFSFTRYDPARPPFDEADLTLAQDLADRAGLAIANAQLFGQLAEERALLTRRVEERTADLSATNAELARATRLKDEFLASMSHELRTPLNAILGRAEALREEIYGPATDRQQAALASIEESGRHLLALINDILDLSKIEAGKLTLEIEETLVDNLCRESLRMVAQTALTKRITLTSTIDSAVDIIQADVRRLKQILVNLLSNAVKFTPAGGQVGLEVRGDAERQQVTFTIWDTGIGIAKEDLTRLFQPFIQLDSALSRQYAGTGLGLALVQRLTEAHGGSVSVESTPGQGSRFSVTLAWVRDSIVVLPGPLPAALAALDSMASLKIGRALVVEDSVSTAAQLTRYLAELGATVETHPYGIGAVERALVMQPDVIILDILLPNTSGWEVLNQLKADPHTRDIPVVVVSVLDEPERGRALGAAAYIVKPVLRDKLVVALRQLRQNAITAPEVRSALIVAETSAARLPRILLAEDNEASINLMEDYLSQRGYAVVVARNGAEALARAQEAPPDLILMDVQMPGMDGLEATRHIRADERLQAIPVIALTALAMPGDRERCLEAGANDYLTKPVSLRMLLAAMAAQLERRAQ
jgi:PAS domain S-box-containing protein